MNGKGVLAFVGKSIAFSLISGLIWGLILVFIASFSIRSRGDSSSSDEGARITQQMDTYDRQAKESQEQLDRSAQQQQRTEALLDTQERLYAEQEQLQKRFAAILDKWENNPRK
jgi:FtsZ-binding cell division protein ZapB